MGRRIVVAVFGVVVAVLAIAVPGATAACPNEAFRTGPSAGLAECRAYEQVTPVDKESAESVRDTGPALVSTSGDGIYFNSPQAYAGAQGNFLNNPYIAKRGAAGWSIEAVGGTQTPPGGPAVGLFGAVSRDLDLSVLGSGEVLAPGGVQNQSNAYLRDNRTGAYTTVATAPGPPGTPPVSAWTPDFSTVLFALRDGMYEFRGGQLRLVAPEGQAASVSEATPNVISTDGSRFYYLKDSQLYLHQDGGETLLASEDEEGNPLSATYPGRFIGATPDDGIAFFEGADGLIYRFEASAPAGDRITLLTPPGREGESPNASRAAVGEDGTHVYFASTALLTPDAEPREGGAGFSLYVWQGAPGQRGALRYIGKSELPYDSAFAPAVSSNGRYFGFASFSKVTPEAIDGSAESCPSDIFLANPQGRCSNVFLYSADANRLACVSCGGQLLGNSRLAGAARGETTNVARPVLDDGMVLFDSPNALSPRDSNGLRDAYAWQGGQTQLVSTGTSSRASSFIAGSADGANLFFATEQQLVGQDQDNLIDLYDARIGGGLPQGGAPPVTPCASEVGCRGAVAQPVAPVTPGTAASAGGAEPVSGCSALKAKAAATKKRSRALARRARQADGKRAKALRKSAARVAKTASRLDRTAGHCAGGGR